MLNFKKTKIVCTIGPSSWNEETLTKLAQAGMNVARLNFSHGTQEEKKPQIEMIRRISESLGKPLAIIADLQGPKLRLGKIDGEKEIKKDEIVFLSTEPNENELPMQFDLSPFMQPEHRIFLNDGLIELKVLEVNGKSIKTVALNDGIVSSNKGVNVPDTNLGRASFTEKDQSDCQFALDHDADYIALSFVQTPDDLTLPREMINQRNAKTKIIVKVEKKEAVENIEEIIKLTDAVMVARGDLAIETPASGVPIIQQKIIKLCRQYKKPVIVATQMLESMVNNPRATRAEVSDVGTAVLDQVDAVMLSAESASGKYPVEAVTTMSEVINAVEQNPDYKHYHKINWEKIETTDIAYSAIAASAASLSYRINSKVLVVSTATGATARMLSAFRPDVHILAVTYDQKIAQQLSLVWGVSALVMPNMHTPQELWDAVLDILKKDMMMNQNDKVVFISGSTPGYAGSTDTIKVVTIN